MNESCLDHTSIYISTLLVLIQCSQYLDSSSTFVVHTRYKHDLSILCIQQQPATLVGFTATVRPCSVRTEHQPLSRCSQHMQILHLLLSAICMMLLYTVDWWAYHVSFDTGVPPFITSCRR